MKRVICLILSTALFAGCFSGVVLADSVNIAAYETFDNIATNGEAENVIVKMGLDSRVVEKKGTDKALYSKADGSSVKINIPISQIFENTVFSYDIMIKGDPVAGSGMKLEGTTTRDLLQFGENRVIKLEDGMDISGYSSGIWKNFAVCVDYNAGCYDLYINGKNVLSKRLFNTKPAGTKTVSIDLGCVEEGEIAEVYLDNIRVYEGQKPLPASAFPSKGVSYEVLDFSAQAAEEQVYETIFIDSDGKKGLNDVTLYPKTETATWQNFMDTEKSCLYFAKEKSDDPYADIKVPGIYENLRKFVYQANVYVVSNTGDIIAGRMVSLDGVSDIKIDSNGNLVVGGTTAGTIPFGKWSTFAVTYDLLRGLSDVYIDGEKVAEKISNAGQPPTDKIRIGFYSGSGAGEVYFDQIKVYDGNEIRKFSGGMSFEGSADDYEKEMLRTVTDNETNEMAQKLLGTDIAFMTSNGKFYAKGAKSDYSAYGKDAYYENGKVYVDTKVLGYCTDTEISVSGNNALIGETQVDATLKDGAYFVDAAKAGAALGKSVYSTDNREFVVLSDSNKGYQNSKSSAQSKEDIDVIWRYLQFDRPTGEDIYEDLKKSGYINGAHPRLLIKKDEVEALKQRVSSNPEMRSILYNVINTCEGYFEKEPQKYSLVGIRLFSACYEVRTRLFNLCTAYLLTGDTQYAERAWLEMENALSWKDWNVTVHFLDAGKIGSGMAYAYDVLYDYLSEDRKELFKTQVQEKFLNFSAGVFLGSSSYDAMSINQTQCNWGSVLSASMIMLSLVLIDEEDEDSLLTHRCRYIISNAMQSMEHLVTIMTPYADWYEGVGYFEYTQMGLAWVLESLDNTTGKTYNFLTAQGVENFSDFVVNLTTPQSYYNYGSPPTDSSKMCAPEAFILAKLYGNYDKMAFYNDFRKNERINSFLPQYLLFYESEKAESWSLDSMPLDVDYQSTNLSVMREEWFNGSGAFVGVTYGNDGHHPADQGSFIFESEGVRWCLDLGRNGSDEMGSIIHRTENHCALTINPTPEKYDQDVSQRSGLVKSESGESSAFRVIDLTAPYKDWVSDYKRGFMLGDERNTLTVRDELTLKESSELYWNVLTDAIIEISADGKSAVMKKNGKTLNVTAYCTAPNWRFEIAQDLTPTGGWAIDPKGFTIEEQKQFCQGKRKLILRATANGNTEIAVKFACDTEEMKYAPVENVPLSQWKVTESTLGAKPKVDMIYKDGAPLNGFVSSVKTYTVSLGYSRTIPTFTAASSNGTVEIKNASRIDEYTSITVTNEAGRKEEYRIFFDVTPVITEAFMETAPQPSLPDGLRKLDIINVISDHEPQSANAAINVADGNLSTRWSSDLKGAYVEVDLGSVYDLSGVAIGFSDGLSRNYKYEIWVSEDKMDYKKVFSGYSVGGTDDLEYLPLPVKARFVRYVGFQHKTGIWNSITEVRPVVSQ